ncbi:MAG: FxsA family protein [Marmoricola sp.]
MSPSRSRRIPWWLLLVLFVAVPLLEIYVLIQVGQVIGAWWTILLLLADGAFGTWLVRREGRRAWAALTQALGQGRMPSTELADGVLVVVGGTLMLAPGFLTDVVGVLCLLPATRPLARRVLGRLVADRLGAPHVVVGGRTRRSPGRDARGGDVVRGEVLDED